LGNSIKLTLYNIIALIETYCKSKIFEALVGDLERLYQLVSTCANLGSVSELALGAAYKSTFEKNPKLGSEYVPQLL
jgi:hypothetical protein